MFGRDAQRLAQAEELVRLADVRFAGGVGTATEIADAGVTRAARPPNVMPAFATNPPSTHEWIPGHLL